MMKWLDGLLHIRRSMGSCESESREVSESESMEAANQKIL